MAAFLALCCSKLTLMTCYHNYIQHNQFLKFADDVKCFFHISTQSDHSALQEDIMLYSFGPKIPTWIASKITHLSFECKLDARYTISDMSMPHCDSHKHLGLILSVCRPKLG